MKNTYWRLLHACCRKVLLMLLKYWYATTFDWPLYFSGLRRTPYLAL